MTTSWQAGPGTSTPCHSDSVPNRQVAGVARRTARTSVGGLVLALAAGLGDVRAARASPRPRPRRPRIEENSPRVRPPAARTSASSSSSVCGRDAVAAGRRQVLGDVEDRLPRVVERAADVEARSTSGAPVARAARACRRRRRRCRRARAWPRSARRCGSPNSLARAAAPATLSGATSQHRAAPRARRLTQTTS